MTDTTYFTRHEGFYVPAWVYEVPETWAEMYFDLSLDYAISMKWGHC